MLKVVLNMSITFTPLSFSFQGRFFYTHEFAYGSRHTDFITSLYEMDHWYPLSGHKKLQRL